MEYYIFCAILAALFLYGIKIRKTDGSQEEMLKRFNDLRGIFALFIVIGHCSMRFEKEVLPLLLIHRFNMAGVCFFLFISGWGLTYGYVEKEKKADGFITRKIAGLLIISFISSLIYYVLNEVILGGSFDLWSIGKFVLENTNWYIWEIIFFYIVFYLCMHFNLKKYIVGILCAAALLICITALAFHWERAFWFSAFSFPFGAAVNRFWDKINDGFRKYKWLPAAVFVTGAVSVFSVMLPQDTLGGCIARNFFGIMAMSILWIILNYVELENRLLKFFKNISLEVYLYQFAVMTAIRTVFEKHEMAVDLFYVICVLAALTALSAAASGFDLFIRKKICGEWLAICWNAIKNNFKAKRWYICTFIITFVSRMLRIRGVYAMRVASDDIGMLSGAAYFAGYDWSSVVSTTKYYGIGWYSLFAPVLRFVKDPAAIWAVIVITNICIVAMACVFIQYIGIKYLGMKDDFITCFISVTASMAVIPSNTISQEAILFCLTVLISYFLLKSIQDDNSTSKCCIFIILAVISAAYAYLIHTRAVVFFIAIPVALIASGLKKKEKLISFVCYAASAVTLYFTADFLKDVIIRHIWGIGDAVMNADLPISTSTIWEIFSLRGIRVVFDCFVSNFFTSCVRLYGIPCVVILLVIMLFLRMFKKKGTDYMISGNRRVLLVFSFICFFVGLAGTAVMWGRGAVSSYWTDEFNVYYKGFGYFRYYATFAGPALFVALGERFDNEKYHRRFGYWALGFMGIVTVYYLLVVLGKLSQSEYVNNPILKYVLYEQEGADILNYILSIGIAMAVLAVILLGESFSKYGLVLGIVINALIPFSANGAGLISRPVIGTVGDAGYDLVRAMEEDGMEISSIYCADARWACFYQFYLKEKSILVGCPAEEGKILVFHSNNLREDERLAGLPESYESIILDDNECVWVSDQELLDYVLNSINAK